MGPNRVYQVLADVADDLVQVRYRLVDARRDVQGWPDAAGGLRADELGSERRADLIAASAEEHLTHANRLVVSVFSEVDAAFNAAGRLYIAESVNHS